MISLRWWLKGSRMLTVDFWEMIYGIVMHLTCRSRKKALMILQWSGWKGKKIFLISYQLMLEVNLKLLMALRRVRMLMVGFRRMMDLIVIWLRMLMLDFLKMEDKRVMQLKLIKRKMKLIILQMMLLISWSLMQEDKKKTSRKMNMSLLNSCRWISLILMC